ncbi:MAG TPA: hypothetical protein VNZ03_13995, partial [Terriglobales bacterium]|nr:hypothetical protein [Terriglobales bacterium]
GGTGVCAWQGGTTAPVHKTPISKRFIRIRGIRWQTNPKWLVKKTTGNDQTLALGSASKLPTYET